MAGPRPLSRLVPDIAGRSLGKRGLAFGPLITDWPEIVGPHLAERAAPDKLVFPRGGARENATLHIRVVSAFALEIQHLEPLIVERINGFFGHRAVARLKMVPGEPTRRARIAPASRPLTAAEETSVTQATQGIEDAALRETMERFGRALLSRPKRR